MTFALGYLALGMFGVACMFAALYHAERANRILCEGERDAWISNASRAREELEAIKRVQRFRRTNIVLFPAKAST